MSASTVPRGHSANASVVEYTSAFTGVVLVIALTLWLSGARELLTHPMWLDECVSALLVTDPHFGHMLSAIYGGVETNGPSFYLLTWPLLKVLGRTDTVAMRACSALFMALALAGMYAICRTFVDRPRAWLATLAVAAHPAVVAQTWQFRGYGLWLAATAWYCWYVLKVSRRSAGMPVHAAGCLLAALLVSIHYFGVMALVIVGGTACVLHRREPRIWRGLLASVAAGIGTFLLCLPMLLHQRAVLSIATWIDAVTTASVLDALRQYFVVPSAGIVVVCLALRVGGWQRSAAAGASAWRTAAPVLALAFFPAAVILVSVLVQPALVERYMLPTVIGIGLVIALAALPARGYAAPVSYLACAGLLVVTTLEMRLLKELNRASDERTARAILTAEGAQRAGEPPVVFARRFEQYPLIHLRPLLASATMLLIASGNDGALMRRSVFERDLSVVVPRFYPQYALAHVDRLRDRPFTIITNSAEEHELRLLLRGFAVTRVAVDTYRAAWQGDDGARHSPLDRFLPDVGDRTPVLPEDL